MRISSFRVVALLAAAAIATPAAAQGGRVVTIATEGAYEPWNFTTPDGELVGFELDLARDLCRRAELTCEIVSQDWNGIIPALLAGRYDAIMAGMSITPARREAIEFSTPYALPVNGFAVLGSGPLAGLPGAGVQIDLGGDREESERLIAELKPFLAGRTLGVQGSTTASNFAETYLSGIVEIREYGTTQQHDLDLAAGRIDGVLANATVLAAAIARPEMEGVTLAGPTFTGGPFGPGIGIGLRKEDEELRAKFDAAIASAAADGSLSELSRKWFGMDLSPKAQ